ncbi:MAG: FISUMP domain-containing protein [Ignavibacteria bacterium]|nr:FISUMP domain-containing protein [Ignavibacteria bacterium]
MKKLIILCIFLNLAFYAQTNVSGLIASDRTWTLAESPYIVTGNILVNTGVRLTIEPGVVVKFNSLKAMQIDGELIVRGNANNKITFTSNLPSPAAGDWGYILFTNSSVDAQYDGSGNYISGSILEYCTIEYAGGASVSDNGSLRLDGAHPSINYSHISNGNSDGIRGYNLSNTLDLRITNSRISDNNSSNGGNTGAIYIGAGRGYILNDTISNNIGNGIKFSATDSCVIINCVIEGNTWKGIILGEVNASLPNTRIINNLIQNNGEEGIASSYCGTHLIMYNKLITNSGGGISLANRWLVNQIVRKNLIYNNQGVGIIIGGAQSQSEIRNNIIVNNSFLWDCGGISTGTDDAAGVNYIANNVIAYNSSTSNSYIINGSSGNPPTYVTHNLLFKNKSAASPLIKVFSNPTLTFQNNFISNENITSFYNNVPQGGGNVNSVSNYWGTTNIDSIGTQIYDWFDDPTKSIVNYSPFLTQLDTIAPISPPDNIKKTIASGGVRLMWSSNQEADVAGYKIYWGDPTGYTFSNSVDVGNVNTYILSGVSLTDEIAVTAYDGSRDGNDDMYDGNESWFSQNAAIPSISLSSPNGSENWLVGSTKNISWSSENIINVKLEYTTNSGTNWSTIIASTPASSGSYAWTIPNSESINCKVKISDADNAATSDQSDNVFTIIGADGLLYGGKIYHTVKIGTQTWLKENLDIGTMIQGTISQTSNGIVEKYCYNNNTVNCDIYGGLYQWGEAMTYLVTPGVRGICPVGWHIPTNAEFQELTIAVGNDGNALKEVGQGMEVGAGTNSSGFSALLGGSHSGVIDYDAFYEIGLITNIWSSSENNSAGAYVFSLLYNDNRIWVFLSSKEQEKAGYNIRCLKNDTPAASLQLTSPNGSETWQAASTQNITWTSTGVTNVKLEYTTDKGTSWTNVIASTPASSGSYAWTIPNTPSTQCKVRATNVDNAALFDVSDTTFTISDGNWVVYNITNSSLPHNSIKSIAVDNAGVKWIGTENGLAKFDGTNWTVYATANSGLPYNYVSAIAIDGAGNKWIGTFSRYLAKYDGVNWTVYDTNDWGLPIGAIQALAIDASGNKWIGTSEGLAKFDGTTGTIYTPSNSGLPYKAVQSIAIDEQGNKWIGTLDSGLVKFDGTNWTVYKTANSQIPNNQVHAIAISRYGNKWLGTTGGFAKYDGFTWNVYDRSADYLDNWVFATAIDNSGNKWTGSLGGVGVFDGTNWTSYRTTNSGLPDSRINTVAIDVSGNKWFGTNAGGVAVLKAGTTIDKTLSLITPNGSESWQANASKNISWSSTNVSNIKLEYSTNSGTNWTTIIASTSAGSGSYAWTVPNTSATTCRVRISDASNNDLTDKSDNVFSIVKIVTSPQSLAATAGNKQVTLKWNKNSETDLRVYRIYGGTSSNPSTKIDSVNYTDTTKTITNLINGTTYYYRITAVDSTGNQSGFSNEVSATPAPKTYTVKTDGLGNFTSIQSAINTAGSGDTIVVYSGTYYENINFIGKDIILRSASGALNTNINGNQAGSCVRFISGETSTAVIDGFTITNGSGTNVSGVQRFGGGIYCYNGSNPTIKNCIITGNSAAAGSGGGIECWYASATIENCIIKNNSNHGIANSFGNGVLVINCLIYGNYGNDNGGGINTAGGSSPTIINSTIVKNDSYHQTNSGIYAISGGTVINSIVRDNTGIDATIAQGTTSVTYSNIDGGFTGTGNIDVDPLFVDGSNNNYHLSGTSPCIGAATSTNAPSKDIEGNPRPNPSGSNPDMGAYENALANPSSLITLTRPNGGENFVAGTVDTIKWTSTNVTNVKLEYTSNSGTSWSTIITSTPATSGKYAWLIPTISSINCKARISDVTNSLLADTSDNIFSINYVNGYDSITYGGKIYHTVKIGNQTWLKENLDIGTMIQGTANPGNNGTIEKYCYNNDPNNCATYGGLYQGNEAMAYNTASGAQGICPTGWHLPTKEEYDTLVSTANGNGNALKAVGQGEGKPGAGTNTSGFSALFAGNRWYSDGQFYNVTFYNYFWSSTSNDATTAYGLTLSCDNNGTTIYSDLKTNGFSVRCIKDESQTASIQLTSPNGGESFIAGTIDTIKWTSINVTNVKLEYTTNSGTNWSTIIVSTPAIGGSYAWLIPTLSSTNCKARISDVTNSLLADTSDNIFSINYVNGYDSITYGGKVYHTVKIGNQTWLKENLDIGMMIQGTASPSNNGTLEKYCYDNNPANCDTYGGLYYWNEAMAYSNNPGAQGICPTGWHVPTIAEYDTLSVTVDRDGNRLKAVGQGTGTGIGTNTSGFSALLAGHRDGNGGFASLGDGTFFWSSTEPNAPSAYAIYFWYDGSSIGMRDFNKEIGFSIRCLKDENPTAFIQLTSPNGSETWQAGSTQNITWTSTGVTNVKLEYTTNSGADWATIIASIPASGGSYAWTIPNTPSTQCKVKISDVDNASVFDTSGIFTITAPVQKITVTSPNGGERWKGNSSQQITWGVGVGKLAVGSSQSAILSRQSAVGKGQKVSGQESMDSDETNGLSGKLKVKSGKLNLNSGDQELSTTNSIENVRIDYSTNNGVNWTTVANGVSAAQNNYNWLVPKVNSQNCKVRVVAETDTTIVDTSDAAFEIYSPQIAVTSPNGGEDWYIGTVHDITWTQSNCDTVKISYSTNQGTGWIPIAEKVATAGSYSWTIPSTVSLLCKVKISDKADSSFADSSNAYFTVAYAPPVHVVLSSPNGGENWKVGEVHNITWINTNVDTVKIELTTNNGTSWTTIKDSVKASLGTFAWTIPNTPSTQCKIRISDFKNSAIGDTSNAVFTIELVVQKSITVTSPNGGENWKVGEVDTIKWTNTNVETVKIEVTKNDGSSWTTIKDSVKSSMGIHAWVIPNTPSAQCRVKISDVTSSSFADTSDNVFSISYESGYDSIIYSGKTYHIVKIGTQTWLKENLDIGTMVLGDQNQANNETIEKYCYDNKPANCDTYGGLYQWDEAMKYVLTENAQGICPAGWHIPTEADYTKLSTAVSSNSNVLKAIGQGTGSGTGTNTSGFSALFGGYRFPDDGKFYNAGQATYFTSSTQYNTTDANLIRLSSIDNVILPLQHVKQRGFSVRCLKDESATASIQLTVPNGGENWKVGEVDTIKWTSTNVDSIKIELTTNNGSNWTTMKDSLNASTGKFAWTIPNTPSTQCKIRLMDFRNSAIGDTSNAVFTIELVVQKSIAVTSPNGGENWKVGSAQNITWTSINVSKFKIEYKINNSGSWIQVGYASASPYSWNIPNTISSQSKVRISDSTNTAISDSSDAVFTIFKPTITVVYPNGGEELQVGSNINISWQCSNVQNVAVEYSITNKRTWNTISASVTASNQSLSWTVPDAISDSCFIRIKDVSDTTIADTSNAKFKIIVASPASLTLTSPIGNEMWRMGTKHFIAWTKNKVTTVKIEFSTNDGSSWSVLTTSAIADSGKYEWTVPNSASAVCRIRISDAANSQLTSVSPQPFEIYYAEIVVTAPNGSEEWMVSETRAITWTSIGVGKVKIELTTDNGANWIVQKDSTAASMGTVTWVVPNLPSINCKIRVRDIFDLSVGDTSDQVFTIKGLPKIQVLSPKAGDTWEAGTTKAITWYRENIDQVKIELSTNSGGDWMNIASSVQASDQSYNWDVQNYLSQNCLVKISDVANPSFSDTSGVFSIVAKVKPVVLTPNGGEKLTLGEAFDITWKLGSGKLVAPKVSLHKSIKIKGTNDALEIGATSNIRILLSTDDGVSWATINNQIAVDSGKYTWTVSGEPSDKCFIKIVDINDASNFDLSDSAFVILDNKFPDILVSTNVLDFETVYKDSTIGKEFTITNTGTADLQIQSLSFYQTSSAYKVTTFNQTIKPDSTRNVSISFKPTEIASYADTLYIYHNAAGSPAKVTLTGSGIEVPKPVIKIAVTSVTFDTTYIGSNNQKTITIINEGTADLFVTNISANKPVFSTTETTFTVGAGLQHLLALNFAPTSDSGYSGTLTIQHNAVSSPSTLSLAGKGKKHVPNIILSSKEINFGVITVYTHVDVNLTINNSGTADLIVTNINSSNNRFAINLTNFTVQPNESKEVTLTFTPINASQYTGTLTISHNAGSGVTTVPMAGAGYPVDVIVTRTISFGDISLSGNYRMVGLPGDSTLPVKSTIPSGAQKTDWNAFYDNGVISANQSDYLKEYDGSAKFTFKPGNGFWIISKNGLTVSANVKPVPLAADSTYSIPLQANWNIISNPFEKSTSWTKIKQLNGLTTHPLYKWNGQSYDQVSEITTYEGFYFYNTAGLSSLKIPYDANGTLRKFFKAKEDFQLGERGFTISCVEGGVQRSSVYAGFNSKSSNDVDDYDYFMPPADFGEVSVVLQNDSLSTNYKKLLVEQRKEIGEGTQFDFTARNSSTQQVQITVNGIEFFPESETYLLDKLYNKFTNLKEKSVFTLPQQMGKRSYALLVGSQSFIQERKAAIIPTEYLLYQNFPNPFNPATTIAFGLPKESNVTLTLYNMLGEVILKNELGSKVSGYHELLLDLSSKTSGVYFYAIQANALDGSKNFREVKKMMLLK